MKILFVAQIDPPGWVSSSRGRMESLLELGHEVVALDTQPYLSWGGRWGGAPWRRLLWGPPVSGLNHDLRVLVADHRPQLVWIEKGRWIFPRTVAGRWTEEALLGRAKASPLVIRGDRGGIKSPLWVHYTPDPALLFHASRHFRAAVPHYDLLVTTKGYEVDLYRRCGARRLLVQGPSFDPAVHRPEEPTAEERQRFACDVVFVGNYARGRERYLLPLARLGVDLAIWGNGWRRRCRDQELLRHLRGDGIGGRDYALALGCARIGLGLLSPLVPDQATTRSVEIPACGTFLLAERSDEHRALFTEGEEAEFFESQEELAGKVRHYLRHPQARERIAAAGHARCHAGGYRSRDRVGEVMARVGEITAAGGRRQG